MNLQILDFIQQIQNIISNSSLPIYVVQLVLKDILNDVNLLCQHQIQIEQQQLIKKQQKEIQLPINKNNRLIGWEPEEKKGE